MSALAEPAWRLGVRADALMRMEFPPIRWIVPGYLAEGCAILAGAPKAGKSWLALGWALAVAAGGLAFDTIRVDQGDVLYLALEDNPRRLQRRIAHMAPASIPSRLTICTTWPDFSKGCHAHLEDWLAGHVGARLIVVDVLAKVRGMPRNGEQPYLADYRAIVGLQELAGRHGVAILVVHHTRKGAGSDDAFDDVSGTRGLIGAADAGLVLRRDPGTDRYFLHGRGRDVPELEKALQFQPDRGAWHMLGEAAEVGRTDERQAILFALRGEPAGMTAAEVVSRIGGLKDSVLRTLDRMAKADEILRPSRGRYALRPLSELSELSETFCNSDFQTDQTGYEGEWQL